MEFSLEMLSNLNAHSQNSTNKWLLIFNQLDGQ